MAGQQASRWAGPTEHRLAYRGALWADSLFGHLVATAVAGVEEWRDGSYRRTVTLPGGPAVVDLRPEVDVVRVRLWLTDPADEDEAVRRSRFLLDLDTDLDAVDAELGADDLLGPLVRATPGRRVPRTVDGDELALRAVLGQQISTAAARTHAARLVTRFGRPVDDPEGNLNACFPTMAAMRRVTESDLAMPATRRRTVVGLVDALAAEPIPLGVDPGATRARLSALPGLGPWTVDTVAMRALGDGDAFLPTDLGVRAAAKRLGLPTTPGALRRASERWRPWRSYAVQHLWATGQHAVNRLPERG